MSKTAVEYALQFVKDLDRLDDKYPGALDEVDKLVASLKDGERPGDLIPKAGYRVFKVRLRNPAAKRGKSGGFRAIYYVQVADLVIMLAFYSKTEQKDISSEEIRKIIEDYKKA